MKIRHQILKLVRVSVQSHSDEGLVCKRGAHTVYNYVYEYVGGKAGEHEGCSRPAPQTKN